MRKLSKICLKAVRRNGFVVLTSSSCALWWKSYRHCTLHFLNHETRAGALQLHQQCKDLEVQILWLGGISVLCVKITLDHTKLIIAQYFNITFLGNFGALRWTIKFINYRPMNGFSLHITNKVKISMASYIERRKREKSQTGFYSRHFYWKLCLGGCTGQRSVFLIPASENRNSNSKCYVTYVAKG